MTNRSFFTLPMPGMGKIFLFSFPVRNVSVSNILGLPLLSLRDLITSAQRTNLLSEQLSASMTGGGTFEGSTRCEIRIQSQEEESISLQQPRLFRSTTKRVKTTRSESGNAKFQGSKDPFFFSFFRFSSGIINKQHPSHG